MSSPDIVSTAFIGKEMHQQMLQLTNDVAYLIELVKDPSRYGELIQLLDPFIDKVNLQTSSLQSKLTEEINRRTKEFETAISPPDNSATLAHTSPPEFLSATDKEEWRKFAVSQASSQQLATFKNALLDNFKEKITKQLQVEKLTEQNTAIKKVLAKIRKTLAV